MANYFTLDFDETAPSVTISSITTTSISSTGTTDCEFDFSVNEDIQAWKVKIITNPTDTHDTGTQIPVTNGSIAMTGSTTITSGDTESCLINIDDFKTIATVEGQAYNVRVFVQDLAGNWG